ncbi:hypothetical protein VTO73DRAFT_1590 [Trametes versicolor]
MYGPEIACIDPATASLIQIEAECRSLTARTGPPLCRREIGPQESSCQERLRPDLAGPGGAPVEHRCATSRIDWRILYSADRAEGQTPPQGSRTDSPQGSRTPHLRTVVRLTSGHSYSPALQGQGPNTPSARPTPGHSPTRSPATTEPAPQPSHSDATISTQRRRNPRTRPTLRHDRPERCPKDARCPASYAQRRGRYAHGRPHPHGMPPLDMLRDGMTSVSEPGMQPAEGRHDIGARAVGSSNWVVVKPGIDALHDCAEAEVDDADTAIHPRVPTAVKLRICSALTNDFNR